MIAWRPSSIIPGAVSARLTAHEDERGSFMELWRTAWTEGLEDAMFVQANLSRSRKGVLRGMHFHRRQADLWLVTEGTALAALADLRAMLDGEAAAPSIETIQLEAGDALYLPRLVAHGFYAMTDLAMVYLVTRQYDSSDEFGFAWDDPLAAIDWPTENPILSQRDRGNPDLASSLDGVRNSGQVAGHAGQIVET